MTTPSAPSRVTGDRPTPSTSRQAQLWLRIGLESFGGGHGTRLNMYRVFVEKGEYLTPLQFAQAWSVSQIGPGMSLVALAALIGYRFSRLGGAAAALGGLLLPSGLITVGMTVAYLRLKDIGVTTSALHGVVAAVLGIAFANIIFNARPLLAACYAKGALTLWAATAMVVADAVVFAVAKPPVVALLVTSAALSGTWAALQGRRA